MREFLAFIIVLALAETAWGQSCNCPNGRCETPQPIPSLVAPISPADFGAAIRIVKVEGYDGNGRDVRTGTIIDAVDGIAYVLTVSHKECRECMSAKQKVVLLDGREAWADVRLRDEGSDLCLLAISDPQVGVVAIEEGDVRPGGEVTGVGYSSGKQKKNRGPLLRMSEEFTANFACSEGDSGGPVGNSNGALIGVICYRNGNHTQAMGPALPRIRRFLARVLPPWGIVFHRKRATPQPTTPLVVAPGVPTVAPPEPPAVPPTTTPFAGTDVLEKRIAALEEKMTSLTFTPGPAGKDGRNGQNGLQGAKGDTGPAGPSVTDAQIAAQVAMVISTMNLKGEQGPAGTSASADQIAAAVSKELKALPITVRKLDGSGKVLGTQQVVLGGNLDFQAVSTSIRELAQTKTANKQ